ncbi:beta-N-acetylhexosaminidase [Pedosphaera parvula]|uniref:beta-N-acetylhexosaminidase n=1 Tax=Pedosphaera parvula (strain Ellin514) TaxID=320771 RepID=B9XDU6_PEDPL|nr:beta-N-acetylhexosaminidase [Pedosphaera parvula]EEF61837.1 Beta-N-acetylhexosaminidase [Pedosphaera parvula Ellin514]
MSLSKPRIFSLLLSFLAVVTLGAAPAIIPLPVQTQIRPGIFTLCPTQQVAGAFGHAIVKILVDSSSFENGQYLAATLRKSTGYEFAVVTNSSAGPVRASILLTTVNALPALGPEGYELTVAPDAVVVRAPAAAGVFYGVQSLLQLFPPEVLAQRPVAGVQWTAPCVYIQDQPRFAWRGVMLDVSRHFVDKQEVERLLDGLALHKINTFHWHLVDDHGWRIQILSYPLLTSTGAWRNGIDYGQNPSASTAYNLSGQYGGYYTQDDIREVVAYARQRHITVVPEIELPAHSTAGLKSYPQFGTGNSGYNMDNIGYGISMYSLAGPGCWTFFTNVLSEVMGLFPGQYIHCGGDEVTATGDTKWTTYSYDANQMTALSITNGTSSSKLQRYQRWFSTNICSFLRSNGRTMVGWSEFEAAGTITNAVLMDWLGTYTSATASNGQYVVVAPNGINYYEENDSNTLINEPFFQVGNNPSYKTVSDVYNFEPVPANLDPSFAGYILGAQCNLWTEFVPSTLNVQYKMFPRVCAEAEMAWTSKTQKNFTDFTNRLTVDVQRLAQMGLNYNRETNTLIGSWGPSVPTSPTTVNYDITPYVTKAGEIDVSFVYTTGSDGINVYSVTLFENGTQLDINTFTGFTGLVNFTQTGNSLGGVAYYVLHLPAFHPGSTYTIQASIAENGIHASSNGKVFLPNWN